MTNNNNASDPPNGQSQRAAASSHTVARSRLLTAHSRLRRVGGLAMKAILWTEHVTALHGRGAGHRWQRAAGQQGSEAARAEGTRRSHQTHRPRSSPAAPSPSRSWPGRRTPPTRLRSAGPSGDGAQKSGAEGDCRGGKCCWIETQAEPAAVAGLRRRALTEALVPGAERLEDDRHPVRVGLLRHPPDPPASGMRSR